MFCEHGVRMHKQERTYPTLVRGRRERTKTLVGLSSSLLWHVDFQSTNTHVLLLFPLHTWLSDVQRGRGTLEHLCAAMRVARHGFHSPDNTLLCLYEINATLLTQLYEWNSPATSSHSVVALVWSNSNICPR